MRYLSLFSGIGGFELGIQQAYEICNAHGGENRGGEEDSQRNEGQRLLTEERKEVSTEERPVSERTTNRTDERPLCIGFSEIDKYATEIYQKHFPNHKNYGDITKIDEKELPDFDLIVGGFPCQAFSIAGKRGGFDDTRGTLFFEIARIIKQKQPRLLLLENVKGLLSHDKGTTFYTIISTLDELGYDCQWQVLNSKNHGVPQNRERVFIIGHLRGTSRPEVFPFGGTDEEDISAGGLHEGDGGRTAQSEERQEEVKYSGDSHNEDGREGSQPGNEPYTINQLNQPTHSNDRVYGKGGLSPTLNTAQGGNRQPFIPEDSKIRRLTPTECERLQGFPDGWTEGVSDTQRYKTLGNAVTVNVIKDIVKNLIK